MLDNLVHRLDVAELVVAFTDPGDRLLEYADSPVMPDPRAAAAA